MPGSSDSDDCTNLHKEVEEPTNLHGLESTDLQRFTAL